MGSETEPKKEGRGRPSAYSDDLASLICLRLMEGETLRQICMEAEMPSQSMVYRWLLDRPDFREKYTQAREAQADHWGDEIIEISDEGHNDWMERLDRAGKPTGTYMLNPEAVGRSKLRVEARQWLMARAAPRKYGDKLDLNHGGSLSITITGDDANL